VALECGFRGYADDVPKPMVQIGTRPIILALDEVTTRIFGHKDFISLPSAIVAMRLRIIFLHYDESVFPTILSGPKAARKSTFPQSGY